MVLRFGRHQRVERTCHMVHVLRLHGDVPHGRAHPRATVREHDQREVAFTHESFDASKHLLLRHDHRDFVRHPRRFDPSDNLVASERDAVAETHCGDIGAVSGKALLGRPNQHAKVVADFLGPELIKQTTIKTLQAGEDLGVAALGVETALQVGEIALDTLDGWVHDGDSCRRETRGIAG